MIFANSSSAYECETPPNTILKIICGINQRQNFIFGGSESYLIGLKSVFAEILGIYRTQYAKSNFMQGDIHPMPGRLNHTSENSNSSET